MYEVKKQNEINLWHPEEVENINNMESNRFIIPQNSYLNMIKNDIVLGLFILYSIYLPLIVGFSDTLRSQDFPYLLAFDIIFILDRFSNLFKVYINANGIPESKLLKVLMHNLSSSIFLEITITIIPLLISYYMRVYNPCNT